MIHTSTNETSNRNSIKKVILLTLLLHLLFSLLVHSILDAEDAHKPTLDDLHQGLLVDVAEEERRHQLHQGLAQQELGQFEAVGGEESVDVGLEALMGVVLD